MCSHRVLILNMAYLYIYIQGLSLEEIEKMYKSTPRKNLDSHIHVNHGLIMTGENSDPDIVSKEEQGEPSARSV